MNRDFAEMLDALSAAGAEFLIVVHMRSRRTACHALRVASEFGCVRALRTPNAFGARSFNSAHPWSRRQMVEIEARTLPFLSRDDLIRNKAAVGRPRDLADIQPRATPSDTTPHRTASERRGRAEGRSAGAKVWV